MRAHLTLDGAVAADGAAPTPDSASGGTAASSRDRGDALWQRLFAGQVMGGAATASKPAKGVPGADDEGPAAKKAITSTGAAAAKDAIVLLAGPQGAAAIPAALPAAAAAAGAGSGRGAGSGAPVSAPIARSTAALRAADIDVPAIAPADAADNAGTTDAQAADPATMARSMSPQLAAAGIGADSDSLSPSLASLASQAPPTWIPTADPTAVAYAGSGGPQASADVSRALRAGTSLVQSLGEHLQVQIAHGSENAVIRLDPPAMGSIEIVIRHEAGAVQVHLSASNSDVLSQLQGIGDALRQDLMQRHQGTVSVQVSDDSRGAQGRQRQAGGNQDESEQALAEAADGEESTQFALA